MNDPDMQLYLNFYCSYLQVGVRQRDGEAKRLRFLRVQGSGDRAVRDEEPQRRGDRGQDAPGGQRLHGEEQNGDTVPHGGTSHGEVHTIIIYIGPGYSTRSMH